MIETAPSGLTAELRRIKGFVLEALAEEAEGDDEIPGGGLGTIVGGCWTRTIDAGPYTTIKVGDVKPDLTKMLKGDLLYWLWRLRAASVTTPDEEPGPWGPGDWYHFETKCIECKHQYPWRVLLSSMKIQKLPEASAEQLLTGDGRFTTTVDGREYTFELAKVEQESAMQKLRKQQKRVAATKIDRITQQTVSIEGLKSQDIRKRYEHIRALDNPDLQALEKAYDAADCGIDTSFHTKCPRPGCRWVQETELPLGKGFFAPKRPYGAEPEPTEEDEETMAGDLAVP